MTTGWHAACERDAASVVYLEGWHGKGRGIADGRYRYDAQEASGETSTASAREPGAGLGKLTYRHAVSRKKTQRHTKTKQHKSTAPDKPTSGGPEDSSAKAGKVEPASPQRESGVLSLDQIKLGIGDTIQLQFQSDVEPSRCFVTLIGYLEGQSVLVTTPINKGSLMLVREGQDFVVRLFSGKTTNTNTTKTKHDTNTPYPHLHLAY